MYVLMYGRANASGSGKDGCSYHGSKALDNLASVNPHALQRSQQLRSELRSCKLRKTLTLWLCI